MIDWKRVEAFRVRNGYTWKQLSELAGMGTMTVYYWKSKSRKSPRVAYLNKLARFMGVTLNDLWIDTGDDDD